MSHRNNRSQIRTWKTAAARELAHMSSDGDPRTGISQKARELLEDAEVTAPPVNLELLGSFQNIHTIEAVEMPEAGRLIPDRRGYRVQVNVAHIVGKRRFTIGHEIGHTLIPAYRRTPHAVHDMFTGMFSGGREEEYLCDVAASELLLPEHLFRPPAASLGFSLDTVSTLSQLFGASREATARRLVDMNIWPCAFAVWHHAFKPSEAALQHQFALGADEWIPPQPKLRVRYAVASKGFAYYLHPHLAASQDGILMRCFTDNRVLCGEECLTLSHHLVTLYVMAAPTNFVRADGPKREVLSLVLGEGGVPPEQADHPNLWALVERDE